MEEKIKNIFDIDNIQSQDPEVFESILEKDNFRVERIVTLRPYENPGAWYNQKTDEWVLLMQGESELEFKDSEIIKMDAGDYIFIPAHKKHRINYSSHDPKCIWLAIHNSHK